MQNAVTEWAADKLKDLPGPLYLILLDHGSPDAFYLTGEQPIYSQDLGEWLDTLQGKLYAEGIDQPIIVIFGACYSGSFIDDLSAPGRIIIASSSADEPSYRGPNNPYSGVRDGEFFTSALFNGLGAGHNLKTAFEGAVIQSETYTDSGKKDILPPWNDTAKQHPLLDDNGDGKGSNNLSLSGSDGAEAEKIFLRPGSKAPELLTVEQTGTVPVTPPGLEVNQALLWAKVSDTERTDKVWAEIRNPDMILEQEGVNQQTVKLASQPLSWNDSEKRYEANYAGFNVSGKYTLFFYVQEKTGLISPFKKAFLYKSRVPVPGDVNGDERTDLTDVILAFKIVCGADTGFEAITLGGDLNGDGKIGIEDLISLLRQLAGL